MGIEAETIRIREKIFQDQQAHFHKEKMKLLADMAAKQRTMNREGYASSSNGATDLIVTIAILGGCLIGVLIAVCACYCIKCKKDFKKSTSESNSNNKGDTGKDQIS